AGSGVEGVLEAIVARIRPPEGDAEAPPRALVFDSEFDQYRGVIAYVRVVDGEFSKGVAIQAMQTGTQADIDDIGFFGPEMTSIDGLRAGEVGYVITGVKDVSQLRVGDTLTTRERPAAEPLPGYREVKPMVFCGLFPVDTDQFEDLRDALEKLALNDAALSYEPETSQALGFGFRGGFLGMLHREIVLAFFDQLKSRTKGYASLDYDLTGMRPSDLVKLDILLAGDMVDALSMVVHKDKAYNAGRAMTERLRKQIPRQQFEVAIQASI